MKYLLPTIAVFLLGITPAKAKDVYHCGYKGVNHMVIKKYIRDEGGITDEGSILKYKVLEDNKSSLVFAHGNTISGFHYAVIYINKKNMSFSRYSKSFDGKPVKMTGQCRRD